MAKNNDIPPSDKALWEKEILDTRKLGRKERAVTPQERSDFAGLDKKITPQHVRGDSMASYLSPDDSSRVDGNLAAKLRKGKLPIEARLDLHGMTQDEAFPELYHFIMDAYAGGKRCVLVVTGKGTRSETGRGVLQVAVPEWINTPDLRPRVLMFCTAQPKDGGTGALYLLLKRQRSE